MQIRKATGFANSNIAFIKYWGNRDHALRLPVNDSLSMNLDGLHTRTTVAFDPSLTADVVALGGQIQSPESSKRVSDHLDRVRALAGLKTFARVESENNFPTGAGIASSASGFAALTVAAGAAAGLALSERELSILARQGSGSASRSIPSGFVEWKTGSNPDGRDSFAFSVAAPDHWALADCIAIVSSAHKEVGSTGGHALARTSPLQQARIEDAPRRLNLCREALLARDFEKFAEAVEEDSTMMHAIMMTSRPPLYYWLPPTLAVMDAARKWRANGLPACFTIDAGPNVHVLTLAAHASDVASRLRALPGVQNVLVAAPGGGASLINE
ncbi:MAG: diphosphomevalonate decarboxylase [Chloroflexi bacterium]|nr:diphosphomevalonate decarboxylase [Chloroflexota bacterium]